MSQYHISHDGEQQGPFGLDEIVKKVKSSELSLMDFIFDGDQNDWVLLMEFPILADRLKDFKPKAPPKVSIEDQPAPDQELDKIKEKVVAAQEKADHLITEWYVLKGENRFGPFAFTDVIKMLQQKVVFEFDFAWHPGLSTWKRIAEIQAFESQNIEQLKSTLMPEIEEVFYRRRHRRVDYSATVLVHDNEKVWKGQGVEISAGGAGVVMDNSMLVPGQKLHLHFKPCDGVPPFNAECEVVSKKYVEGVKDQVTPIRYGLKFLNINPQTQEVIQNYSKAGGKGAAA